MTYFTGEQVELLLKPIHPKRVRVRDGMSHVEGYDIRAELTRVFGFGRWTSEILDQSLICETEVKTKTYTDSRTGEEKGGKPAWYVVYRSRVRLTVFAPDGTMVTYHDGSHVGESTHPVRGEAHGNALTNSETYALRRAAINLGDQFGLSLYNKGSLEPIVRWTLVRPEQAAEASTTDTDDVPQVSAEDTGQPAPDEDESPGEASGHAGQQQRPRPAPAAASQASDHGGLDAQTFADEAHNAATPGRIEDIHCRAREAGKLTAVIRNPGSGKSGQLALYLDWRRKHLLAAARLAPEDPWAQKVADLAGQAEAEAAIADIGELVAAGTMDAGRGGRIEVAIRARFPEAGRSAEARAA